jgi:hypothetical protein
MTLTVSHQCPTPHVAEACEVNGLAPPSARAPAMPRCSPLSGPTAVSGRRTARPTVVPVMQARLLVLRCHTPPTRLSFLQHASRVGRRRPQASQFQGLVLGSDYPRIFSTNQVVNDHRRRRLLSTRLLLVMAHPHPLMVISRPLPHVRH